MFSRKSNSDNGDVAVLDVLDWYNIHGDDTSVSLLHIQDCGIYNQDWDKLV
jgi:hypothetical protein